VEANGNPCDTLLECFASLMYWGVPGGQLIQFLQPFFWPDSVHTFFWIVFVDLFFVVVGSFLINIFLAVIVDAFGQLRDAKMEAEDAKSSRCFICSNEMELFKRQGVDFRSHIENDHNIWHYLYFFVYLKEQFHKHDTELSESECELQEKINKRQFLSFFPIERAVSLQGEEEEFNSQVLSKLNDLQETTQRSMEHQEKITKENKELKATIGNLQEEVTSLRRMTEGKAGKLTLSSKDKINSLTRKGTKELN